MLRSLRSRSPTPGRNVGEVNPRHHCTGPGSRSLASPIERVFLKVTRHPLGGAFLQLTPLNQELKRSSTWCDEPGSRLSIKSLPTPCIRASCLSERLAQLSRRWPHVPNWADYFPVVSFNTKIKNVPFIGKRINNAARTACGDRWWLDSPWR